MSVILAFGLSPLGQVPAYADEGVTTQAAEVQTQEDNALSTSYKLVVNDVTYDTKAWFDDASSDITKDRLTNSVVSVFYYPKDADPVQVTVPVQEAKDSYVKTADTKAKAGKKYFSDAEGKTPLNLSEGASVTDGSYELVPAHDAYTYVKDGKAIFTLEFQDDQDKTIAAGEKGVRDAGTYKVVITGAKGSAYQGQTNTATFKVKQLDISKSQKTILVDNGGGTGDPVEYPPIPNVKAFEEDAENPGSYVVKESTLEYLGKAQNIEYKLEDTAGTPAIMYPTLSMLGKDLNGDDETVTLDVNDFYFAPSTVTARGPQAVTLMGKGNCTGSWETSVVVDFGEFATEGNTKVNGVANDPALDSAQSATDIDLTGTEHNPVVGDSDPAATGKVVFGDTVLTKGTDYTVKYYQSEAKYTEDAKNNAIDAPTTLGNGYYAVITAKEGTTFKSKGSNTIRVTYNITGAERIDQVAEKADFGSVPFLAESTNYADYSSRLVAPTTATFTSESGADVSAAVGSDWEIVSVKAWTDDMEREFLGEEKYAQEYPHSDTPYANTDAAKTYCTDNGTAGVVERAVWTETVKGKTKTVYGFNGLPAGDYQLTVKGAGSFKGGTVAGKFTIAKATAQEGTTLGTIKVKPGTAGHNDGNAIDFTKSNNKQPVLTMVAGTDDDGKPLETDPLTQGTALSVAKGVDDYYVTYMKDGEAVTPADAGKYDAVFTFGGNDFAESSFTVKDALTVGTPELNSKVKFAEIVVPATGYMFSGGAVTPQLKFYSVANGSDAKTTGVADLKQAVTDAEDACTTAEDDYNKNKSDESLKADYEKAQKALADAQAALDKVTLDLTEGEDYTVSYAATGTSKLSSFTSDGKPVGPGTYEVTVYGTGNFVTSEGEEVTAAQADGTKNFEVEELDISSSYTTVQFKDGDKWVDTYSTVKGDKTLFEPEYRLVTTASKSSDNPVVISDRYYKGEYENNRLVGTAKVNLTATDSQNGYVKAKDEKNQAIVKSADFYIASGTFEAAGAAIKLTPSSEEYTGVAHDLDIKVMAGTATLAPQLNNSEVGDYIWSVKGSNGKEIAKSTDANAASKLKAGLVNVGKYTVTVSGGPSALYAGELTDTFEITAKAVKASQVNVVFGPDGLDSGVSFHGKTLTKSDVTAIQGGTFDYYGGDQITAIESAYGVNVDGVAVPFTEVKDAAKAKGNNYTIENNTAKNAGTYSATITFCGNYSGTITKTWKVEPVSINNNTDYVVLAKDNNLLLRNALSVYGTGSAFDKKEDYNVDYDGKKHEPEVAVYTSDSKGNPVDIVKGLTYTYLYDDQVNAGQFTARVTIIADGGNFTGRMYRYFTINALDIASDRLDVQFPDEEVYYNGGKAVEPKGKLTYTISDGSKIDLTYGKDYTIQEYSGDNVNVGGQAYAKIVGLGNFVAGNKTFVQAPFTVKANPQEQKITASDVKVTYGKTKAIGAKAETALTYKSSNEKVATVDANGKVKGVKAGTAKITITAEGTDAYKAAETTVTVTVAKAANTMTVAKATRTAKGVSKAKKTVKGITVKKAVGTVTYTKAKVNKNAKKFTVNKKTGKVTVAKGTKAGTYKVTVKATAKGNTNYNKATKKAVVTIKVKK